MEPNESNTAPMPAPAPFAPPLPVQPLDYSAPTHARPGLLTAVAILSIVIGGFSVLTGCSSAFTTVMMQFMPLNATVHVHETTSPLTLSLFLGIVDALLRLVLAAMLIVAGVFVLRDHPLGRRLHVIWAWVKIPASVLGALVYWRTMTDFLAALPATPPPAAGPQSVSASMMIAALTQAAIACAYPIAVLIVMHTRVACDYFNSPGAAGGN